MLYLLTLQLFSQLKMTFLLSL